MYEPLTRIDPALPVCWESPDTIRLGFDHAEARLVQPSAATQRLLSLLQAGVHLRSLTGAAASAGATAAERRALIEQLAPVLVTDSADTTSRPETGQGGAPVLLRVAVLGDGVAAERFGGAMARTGCEIVEWDPRDGVSPGRSVAPPDLAVVVERYMGAPAVLHALQTAHVPHLVARFTDRSARVGPLIAANSTVCATCVNLHEVAADPVLPVLATQLQGQKPAAESPAAIEWASALAAGVLHHWLGGAQWPLSTQLRVAIRDGLPTPIPEMVQVRPHPECGCALLRGGTSLGSGRAA